MAARLRQFIRLLFLRPRYRITQGGLLFMLALGLTGAGAFLSGNNLLFLIFAAMLAVLMISGIIGRLSLAGLELELLLPAYVSAREATPARIRIRNLKRRFSSLSIQVSGEVEVSGGASGRNSILAHPVYFPVIPGNRTVESAVSVAFPRRGRHSENLFRFTTRFPFGLVRRSARVVLRNETLVFPSVSPPAGSEALPATMSRVADARRKGLGEEWHRIRPREEGDDARQTDWKSTARTGTVHVRDFGNDETLPLEIILDRSIAPGAEARFEMLVDRCAFACWELTRSGVRVRFRTSGSDREYAEIYDILEQLALVQPIPVESVLLGGSSESLRDFANTRSEHQPYIFSTHRDLSGVPPPDGHMMIPRRI